MQCLAPVFFAASLIVLPSFLSGCTCSSDEESGIEKGESADDAVSDDSLDGTGDNVIDDSDNDDSRPDDDSHSDDAGDDGLQDDTADDATDDAGDDDSFSVPEEIAFEVIEGGAPGHSGTAVAIGPSGEKYIAAVRAKDLNLYTATNDGTFIETIGRDAERPRIAADAQGFLHVLYNMPIDGLLIYADNTAGWWISYVLETDDRNSGGYSIATDSQGAAHVMTISGLSQDRGLFYATNRGGAWQKTQIDSGSISDTSIAVDRTDHFHAAYVKNQAPAARLIYVTDASGSMVSEVVDSGYYLGGIGYSYSSPEIALDPSDEPRVFYYTYENWGMYGSYHYSYAAKSFLGWSKIPVGGLCNGGAHRMVIDSQYAAHVVLSRRTASTEDSFDLFYASNRTGSWVTELIDSDGGVGADMAIDAEDRLYISHMDDRHDDLKLLKKEGDGVSTIVVDDSGASGALPTLVIRQDGHAHILHLSYGESAVRYTTNAGGTWASENIAPLFMSDFDYTWFDASAAMDSEGRLHVGLTNYRSDEINYITNSSGIWTSEPIDATGGDVRECVMGVGAPDAVHAAYLKGNPSTGATKVRYGTRAGGAWSFEDVTLQGFYTGWGLSLALDADNHAHLAYVAPDGSDDLKFVHATNASGSWVFEDVATGLGDLNGIDSSIETDSDGFVHLTLCGLGSDGIGWVRYAANASGAWNAETVDEFPDARSWIPPECDLAMDGDGAAHISYRYFSGDLDALRAATNRSGLWRSFFIARNVEEPHGFHPSMAIDGAGFVHVAYQDAYALWQAAFPADLEQ